MSWNEIVRRFAIKMIMKKGTDEPLGSHTFQISRECKIDVKGDNRWTTIPTSSMVVVKEDKSIDWMTSEEFDKIYYVGALRTMRAGDIKLGDEN
jgi:hypothetical protein